MKLSDLTPEQWYGRLNTRRLVQRRNALGWWQYLDLEQPLVYVARILREQGDRFPPLLINWAELVLASVEERLILETFLLEQDVGQTDPGAAGVGAVPAERELAPVDDLDEVWQRNDLDELAPEVHFASMVSGQAFTMVGPGQDDVPLITIEYEDQVAVELDPLYGQPIAGLKVWREDGTLGGDELGALYLKGGKGWNFVNGKLDSPIELGKWATVIDEDPRLPSVPFVPMLTNRRRGCGKSDLVSLKPLLDGANQIATNMMAAAEHHAVSRKWIIGATQKDFVDDDGNEIPLWKIAMGDVWGIPHRKQENRGETPQEVKVGQFPASDLRNFIEVIKMLATLSGSLYGLPPGYMGYTSDNPPSAESILYSLDRLVRRTEKRQLWYGGGWERTNRIAWAIMDRDPRELTRLESKWRDAATPTRASAMDAAQKGVASGILDVEQAWVDLNYSQQTIRGLRRRRLERGQQVDVSLRQLDQLPVTPTTLPGLPAAGAGTANGAPVLRS